MNQKYNPISSNLGELVYQRSGHNLPSLSTQTNSQNSGKNQNQNNKLSQNSSIIIPSPKNISNYEEENSEILKKYISLVDKKIRHRKN